MTAKIGQYLSTGRMTSTTPSGVESSKDEVYRLRMMDYVDIWSMWAELKKVGGTAFGANSGGDRNVRRSDTSWLFALRSRAKLVASFTADQEP